ncbi:MAG: flavin reductase [Flavobacteriaceae bacterium]|nr:flavin reductase [Flavobacteriaceae bacterium]
MDLFKSQKMVQLDMTRPIWDRIFTVAPLVVIGTKEGEEYDLAPKHMATPLGFDNFFGFVCTPDHSTYGNIEKAGEFSVSFPLPDQVIMSSLAASPRCDERSKSKSILNDLPLMMAPSIDAPLLASSYLYLECSLFKIIDGFWTNSLICGEIIGAYAQEDYIRQSDVDPQEQLFKHPLLAYIATGRYAEIKETHAFPFPKDFKR